MPRRMFQRFHECRPNRALRVRLDPIEGGEVWNHDLYANSPLARLKPRQYGISAGRPWDGYAIVDLDAGRDIGLILRGKFMMEIPMGRGRPEDGVDRLPSSRLWISVLASCEADWACRMLWEALGAVVDPVRLKGQAPRAAPPPDDPISDEDLDALAGIVS